MTTPGGIFWRPDYGIGITDFLNVRASAAEIVEMKNRIRSTLASDPAVEEVSPPEVVVNANGMIEVKVDIKVAGQVQPIALGVRAN